MRYFKVTRRRGLENEPTALLDECDEDGSGIRKIEISRERRANWEPQDISTGESMLSVEPMPGIAEINSDPQFPALAINASGFERAWLAATSNP